MDVQKLKKIHLSESRFAEIFFMDDFYISQADYWKVVFGDNLMKVCWLSQNSCYFYFKLDF